MCMYIVFGRGTVVVKSCRQQFDRLMRTAQLFGVRECKFPAAANSWGTPKSFLCIQNSIISIRPSLSNGVCEYTRVAVTHTHMHSAHMQGVWGEGPLHVPVFTSILGVEGSEHMQV